MLNISNQNYSIAHRWIDKYRLPTNKLMPSLFEFENCLKFMKNLFIHCIALVLLYEKSLNSIISSLKLYQWICNFCLGLSKKI